MKHEQIIQLRKLSQQYAYTSIQLHEAVARKAGFPATDHKYLGFFLQKGSMTAGELASLTGLTTGAVTGLIDRFEEKDLVKREFDKQDRRKIIIAPDVEKIKSILQPLYEPFQNETDDLMASFSSEELDVLENYFHKYLALLHHSITRLNGP
jgi:DNA-binding MarR family transcriptional regulator